MKSTSQLAPPPNLDRVPTRAGYDRWAEIYDEYDNPLVALETAVVRRFLGDVSGLEIADIGCGTGRHTVALALNGARVTGIDACVVKEPVNGFPPLRVPPCSSPHPRQGWHRVLPFLGGTGRPCLGEAVEHLDEPHEQLAAVLELLGRPDAPEAADIKDCCALHG